MHVVVKTRYGEVRSTDANGVTAFKGVPDAAPPFGPNWLRSPQPVEPWCGVPDALAFGPKPPRLPFPPPWDLLDPDAGDIGEDCLNLNIWSPDPGSAGRPVRVWFPGAMFEGASGAAYDDSRFVRDGVVCLTIEYRCGADGFLALGD